MRRIKQPIPRIYHAPLRKLVYSGAARGLLRNCLGAAQVA
jgi:hypothetical protein